MKFIKKIEFDSFNEIKQALNENLVVHAVPLIKSKSIEDFYIKCIRDIGILFESEEDFITNNKTGKLWSDIVYCKDRSESFSHSNTRQPFHTDGAYEKNAPDLTFFYCINQAKFGGFTIFIDNNTLIECLDFYDKELLSQLRNTEINFQKGNDSKKSPIIDRMNNLNWNYFRVENNYLVEKFNVFLEDVVWRGGIYESVSISKDESLFFWDSKVLHGRTAFLGDRHLRKAGIYV